MSRRAVNWSVIVFALAWFGVLVPVHNRGQIAPFGARPCADDHACCASDRPANPSPAEGRDRNPARACAVCFFIAGLDTPPPPTLVNHRFTPAARFEAAPPAVPDATPPALPLHSRAPPVA